MVSASWYPSIGWPLVPVSLLAECRRYVPDLTVVSVPTVAPLLNHMGPGLLIMLSC